MRAMPFIAAILPFVLLLGCISMGEGLGNSTNQTNATNTTEPPPAGGNVTQNQSGTNATQNATNQTIPEPPKLYERYMAKGFSFEYPLNMTVQESHSSYGGIFTGSHEFGGQTGEILVVSYINITSVYGKNKEGILQSNPTKASSDFLIQDKKNDPAGSFLNNAYDVGEITNFGVARDGYVAEAPFQIRFGGSNKTYTGYALDIYVPERSLLAKVRVIALDSDKAEAMYDNFLLSFRIEAP